MAVCLEDEDERISSLAKLFFHELSKKGQLTLSLSVGSLIVFCFSVFVCAPATKAYNISTFFLQGAILFIICFRISLENYPTRI